MVEKGESNPLKRQTHGGSPVHKPGEYGVSPESYETTLLKRVVASRRNDVPLFRKVPPPYPVHPNNPVHRVQYGGMPINYHSKTFPFSLKEMER